ncbi:MAG: PAS domain S-box protein [Anaerolineae bacterium]|jgi:PAS domain S-box-containing protein
MPAPEKSRPKIHLDIAFATAVTYGVLGSLWILLSDRLVNTLATSAAQAARWQTIKGWGYTGLTSLALYAVLKAYLARQKRAEQALHESEAQLAAIVDNLPFLIMIVDKEQQVRRINHVGAAFAGRPAEDVLGLRSGDALRCVHALDDPEGCGFGPSCQSCVVRRTILATLETGEGRHGVDADMTLVTEDGETEKTLLLYTIPLTTSGEKQVMVVLQDITQRKQVEQALRESEAKFRTLFNSAGDAIYIHDLDGRFLEVSEEAVRRLGYSRDELLHMTPGDIDAAAYAPLVPERIQRIQETGHTIVETEHVTKDGETIPTELSSRPILYEGERAILSIARDVSERKHMEEQLRQQQRLAAVGQLAAGVAHDFRNLLTTILLYAQMDIQNPDLPSNVADDLDVIIQESTKAADLVQQMLDFSSQAMIEREPIDLVPFIEAVLDNVLRRTIPENIDLRLATEAAGATDTFSVTADPGRLQQALINLALNARDAMPEGGELRFTLSTVDVPPDAPPPVANMPPGEFVRLAVSDTGTGMTEDVMEHLFEPFFTTKDVDQGTGLGLAQVYGIVRQHEGYIDVATELGVGTTFHIYLPPAQEQDSQDAAEAVALGPKGRGETVLVVEDAEAIRQAVQDGLGSLNYRVLTATNGREAIETVLHEDVHLVLTDVVMPKMGGKTLLRELRARAPHLKIIAMTGYTAEADADELREVGFEHMITKPFSIRNLATLVRDTLDESET